MRPFICRERTKGLFDKKCNVKIAKMIFRSFNNLQKYFNPFFRWRIKTHISFLTILLSRSKVSLLPTHFRLSVKSILSPIPFNPAVFRRSPRDWAHKTTWWRESMKWPLSSSTWTFAYAPGRATRWFSRIDHFLCCAPLIELSISKRGLLVSASLRRQNKFVSFALLAGDERCPRRWMCQSNLSNQHRRKS